MATESNPSEQLRGRKTLVLALAGGILGVAASVMAYHYLEREETQLREQMQSKQSQDDILVVVAKANLAAGSEIGDGNMATRHVPKDYVYPETILPGNFDKVRGQTLVKALAKGQPLLSGYLSEGGVAGLSDKLKEGRRAVTINVDEVSSINGLIHPGDRIDLLFSGRGGANGSSVVPLLQNLKVLATGSQYAPTAAQPGQDKFGLVYSTLTLDVTPEEAARITLARELGVLTATLRGRNDDQSVPHAVPLTASQLFGPMPAAPAVQAALSGQAAAPADTVTYIVRGELPGVASMFELPVGEVPTRALVSPESGGKPYAPTAGGDEPVRTRDIPTGMEQKKR